MVKHRENSNTTLNQELYFKIKLIALAQHKRYNELLEEGMREMINKYQHYLPEEYKNLNIQNLKEVNKIE